MSNITLSELVREELARAKAAGASDAAWRHLERAHILSQSRAWLHTRVHLAMLSRALREMDGRELVGQLLRVALAAPSSLLGLAPLGNDGRAATPARASRPISPDLAELLARAGVER